MDRWEDTVVDDPAQYLDGGPHTCWILGIAGAATRAVRCLRTYLVKPTYAMPFMDPHMPFFDGIRDDPEFVALIADIEAGKYDRWGPNDVL